MKNVTITLDENVARRARIEAAREGVSLSKFIAGLIEQRVGRPMSQKEAAERFLNGPLWPGLSSDLPTKAELWDEMVFPRHEHTDLRPGPSRTKKATPGG